MSAALFGLGLVAAGGAQALAVNDLIEGDGAVCFGDCSDTGSGERFTFKILINPRSGDFYTDGSNEFQSSFGDTVVIGMAGNADPIMIASISAIDFGAPTTFGFTFTSPFAPTAPAGAMLNSMATLTGTLSDADGGDGAVSATAFLASSTIMQTLVQGVPVTAVGPTASSNVGAGGTLGYGPHSASMAFTCPATGCDNFGIQLAFTGAGGGDQYQFTATHELTPAQGVPAPIPLMLIGFGLLGMGGARRLIPS
ncbi:MAG: hypothetical protein R3E46_08550 [Sedimenticolaceae bacterium]